MGIADMLKAKPVNVSRRGFLAGAGSLVLATTLPVKPVRGQEASDAPAVQAFMELRADGTVLLKSPFIEGGQGVYTAMAQIVGEELDLDPSQFTVEIAPPGGPFGIMGGFLVGVGRLDFGAATYLHNTLDFLTLWDVTSGLIKGAVFGFLVALMGCYFGMNSGRGAQGVGRATKSAVVAASVLILASNYLLTELFFSA